MDFTQLHKVLEVFERIKSAYYIAVLAFIVSFSMWFLSIYFFSPTIFANHGLAITLLIAFVLANVWCYLMGSFAMMCVSIITLNYGGSTNDELSTSNTPIFIFAYASIVSLQSLFLYLQYDLQWHFHSMIRASFLTALLLLNLSRFVFLRILKKSNKVTQGSAQSQQPQTPQQELLK